MHFEAFCNRDVVVMFVKRNILLLQNFLISNRFSIQTRRVMRLSTILILACIMQVSAKTYSQSITYSCKNESLENVFKAIRAKTGYLVFYDQNELDKNRKVTLNVDDQPLETLVRQALKDLPVSYSFEDKTIIISKRSFVNQMIAELPGESQLITGSLKDVNGNPIGQASLTLIPGNIQVTSASNGVFVFPTVMPGKYTLQITHVSFERITKEIVVGNAQLTINITMKVSFMKLQGVTISTGYQQIDKSQTTGATGVKTDKDIAASPDINLINRLVGTEAGVYMDPRTNRIQMRGTNNFDSKGTEPLIIIDGFPAMNQNFASNPGTGLSATSDRAATSNAILGSFNPSDIESITFLKDAAAAAIWGSKAANGVIVIETKKGRKGLSQVNLSTIVSMSAPADMSKLNVMNGAEYIDFERELFDKNYYTDANSAWRYPAQSKALDLMFNAKSGKITAEQRDQQLAVLAQRDSRDQMKKYLLQNAMTQQYNLSVSGGGGNSTYHISGNYSKDRPVFKGNSAESYFVTANMTNDLFHNRVKLTTGINQTISNSNVNHAAIQAMGQSVLGLRPYDVLVDENGNSVGRPITFQQHIVDSLTAKGYMPWALNSIDELNRNNIKYRKSGTRLNTKLDTKILPWLELSLSGMYQRSQNDLNNLVERNSYPTLELINTGTTINPANGRPVYNYPNGGILKQSTTTMDEYNVRGQLNVNKQFGADHLLNFLAGSEIRETKFYGYNNTRYGYDPETGTHIVVSHTTPYSTIYNGAITIPYVDGSIARDRKRYLSYYSNANYAFRNRYHLSGSVRFDDYSMIGVERRKRAIPLWSAGAKWDIRKEAFMSEVKVVNMLDLRLTYGSGGTVPGEGVPYSLVTVYAADGYSQQPYATIGTPGNQQLGWETTKTLNAGLDVALFDNRLSVGLDVYRKRSNGILRNLPSNPTIGWPNLTFNASNLNSHGVELTISGDVIRSRDWRWNSSFNFSYNTNKVADARYPDLLTTPNSSPVVIDNYSVDALFVYKWAGLDEKGQSQIFYDGGKILTSDMTSTNLKPTDKVYAGRKTPPYFGGFMNTFTYKNLSLSTRFTYFMGHKMLKGDISTIYYPTSTFGPGFLSNSKTLVNRWRQPGDEAFTNVPGLTGSSFASIDRYNNADINVIDAGNIRFQQITLNYNLPVALVTRTGFMKSVTVGATASNLGLIWKKNKAGLDPDYIFAGVYNSLPPAKNYTVNVNVSF